MVRLITCALCALFLGLPDSPAPRRGRELTFQATLESIKIDAQPQQVVTRQFRLTLDPNQPDTRFKAKVEDWWRSEDGKQSFYAEGRSLRHSCARWVIAEPGGSDSRPGETLVIRITVAVPPKCLQPATGAR